MKRLDDGKPSLVDFMRSIRFNHHHTSKSHDDYAEHFAELDSKKHSSRTSRKKKSTAEDKTPIRSAN